MFLYETFFYVQHACSTLRLFLKAKESVFHYGSCSISGSGFPARKCIKLAFGGTYTLIERCSGFRLLN